MNRLGRGIPRVTHCPQGHEYTPENTYSDGKFGYLRRECRQCKRKRKAAYKARVRAKRRKEA